MIKILLCPSTSWSFLNTRNLELWEVIKGNKTPNHFGQTNMGNHWSVPEIFPRRKLENHLTIWLVELAHQSAVVSDLQVDLLTVMEKRVRSFKKRFIHPTRHYHTKAMWVCLHTLLDTKMKLGGFSQILSLSFSLCTGFSPVTFTDSRQTHIYCCDWRV